MSKKIRQIIFKIIIITNIGKVNNFLKNIILNENHKKMYFGNFSINVKHYSDYIYFNKL